MLNLKFIRLLRGQSQFDIAIATRIPNYRLSRIENGKAKPSTDELQRLAQALKIPPDQLTRKITEEVLCNPGAPF